MTEVLLERALLPTGLADDVRVTIEAGRFTSVTPQAPDAGLERVRGVTVPGFANTHSHAFHRALRGRTQAPAADGPGSFWTWRTLMYDIAARLTPDSYYALARATYAEMANAGITCVGEFHYVHHNPDGRPYADANAMGHALLAAASDVGIRITLLDTLYLSSGFGAPPEGQQRRFCDASAEQWLERVDRLTGSPQAVIGHAVHSIRAVAPDQIRLAAAGAGGPFHAHVSEQPAENAECLAAYGGTPLQVLADAGALSHRFSAVHATHVTAQDRHLVAQSGAYVAFCPTTERDLGDGIGPAADWVAAGVPLTFGSDSQAVIDLGEEMRALELHQRLASQARGWFSADQLLAWATHHGHHSLGWPDAGQIAPGQHADLVVFDQTSPRTAGTGGGLETVVFAASAADVTAVMASGRWVHSDARDVGRALSLATAEVLR